MPFLMVNGIPEGTKKSTLTELRKRLVSMISYHMDVPNSWVRVFFPTDWLDEPSAVQEGSNTIFVKLETALFNGDLSAEKQAQLQNLLNAIAKAVWEAFAGKYEVEMFVCQLNAEMTVMLTAQP